MGIGQYVVYEQASREEEKFFLILAKEVTDKIKEPKTWMKKRQEQDKKHHPPPGGRPTDFEFKPMLLVLLLMVYHRKEYREMAAHLKNNPALVAEIGLKKAPSKSSIHSACKRIGIDMLAKLNDEIIDRFKKILELEEPSMYSS